MKKFSNSTIALFFSLWCITLLTACVKDKEGTNSQNRNSVFTEISPSFEVVTSYGSDLSELEAILGRPNILKTDADGNVYVSDDLDLSVKVFQNNGQYIRSIGTRGEGPAEFEGIQ